MRLTRAVAYLLSPTLTRQGESLQLSISAAWDQSGVTSSRVRTSSGLVSSMGLRDPLATSTVRNPVGRRGIVKVTVTATDSATFRALTTRR